MNREMPESQIKALAFITAYIAQHQYPPSIREVMNGAGLASTSATRYTLRRLAELGYIEVIPRVARGIRLLSIAQIVNVPEPCR